MTEETPSSDSDQPSLEDLISLREAAELSGLSAGHLRLLASRGEIWAVKLGRNWVTTAKAVEEYLAQLERDWIDAQFAEMEHDKGYQVLNRQIEREFARSDWEALQTVGGQR